MLAESRNLKPDATVLGCQKRAGNDNTTYNTRANPFHHKGRFPLNKKALDKHQTASGSCGHVGMAAADVHNQRVQQFLKKKLEKVLKGC